MSVEPSDKTDQEDSQLEFDDSNFEVDISDSKLEEDDKAKEAAKQKAKKVAKKFRTPEELRKRKLKIWISVAAFVVVVLVALFGVPTTRWPILNFIGFRGNLEITVQAQGSGKRVTKASVELDDTAIVSTNEFGQVTFRQIRLGNHTITTQKPGYGDATEVVTNKLGTTKATAAMKVIGIELDFSLKNWLSNQPVEGADITFGTSNAKTDPTGSASLIVPPTDQASINVTIAAPGYLTKTVPTQVNVASREVSLVSSEKDYFISNRDGSFDIYSSNLDGSDQQKIIEATGKEDSDIIQFEVDRDDQHAILVANRDGQVINGQINAGVYAVDLQNASLKEIDQGSNIQLIDWANDTIVYTKTNPSLAYNDPALNSLMSYNVLTGKLTQISQTNYFSVALVAENKVFYMPTNPYATVTGAALTSEDLTTGAQKTYLSGKQIAGGTRSAYDTLMLQDTTGADYTLQVSTGDVATSATAPSTSFTFALSQNGQLAAWTDRRDGKGALLTHNVTTGVEQNVAESSGLTYPIRFISSDLVVARVATSDETADYVISISSGNVAKIVDVSNISINQQPDGL